MPDLESAPWSPRSAAPAAARAPALDDPSLAPGKWTIICLALYLLRVTSWALAELWHDEVITLGDFVIGPVGAGPLHVFRSYPVANNHMLFSALGWWWVRLTGFSSDEYVLRLPCILLGGAAIVLAVWGWRRWLGPQLAALAGLALAISPVFTGFASEFRGYAMTMLLAAVAVQGLAELTDGRVRRGLALQLPALMLLPLVIPSNVFLGFAHGLFVLLWPGRAISRRARLGLAVALVGAAALGLSYYLTLWDQFSKALRETTGWPSGSAVLGAVAIGFCAHLGLAPALLVASAFRPATPSLSDRDRGWGALYAGCLAVPVLGTLFGDYTNAPFPRVYLVFLLPFTFAAFRCLTPLTPVSRRTLLLWAGLAIAIGFGWERGSALRTQAAVGRGEHPQNLLELYYRDRGDLRGLAALLSQDRPPKEALVVTDAYDFPTFRYYWSQLGLPIKSVFPANRLGPEFWPQARQHPGVTLHVVAGDEIAAARLFSQVGAPGGFVPGPGAGQRRLYSLLPSSAPPRP